MPGQRSSQLYDRGLGPPTTKPGAIAQDFVQPEVLYSEINCHRTLLKVVRGGCDELFASSYTNCGMAGIFCWRACYGILDVHRVAGVLWRCFMILVLGSVVVQDGRVDEALRVSLDHVRRSRQEPGCVSHAVYRDAENPQRLVFVEQWSDQAALAEHFKVPASRQFVKELGALAAQPPAMSIYAAEQLQS